MDYKMILDKRDALRTHISCLSTFYPDTLVMKTDHSNLETGRYRVGWVVTIVERGTANGPAFDRG